MTTTINVPDQLIETAVELTGTETSELSITSALKDGQVHTVITKLADGKVIADFKLAIVDSSDFTPSKALIVAWLGLGLFVPLGERVENLAEHGLSSADFMVTADAIMVARAYRELTKRDITEAI